MTSLSSTPAFKRETRSGDQTDDLARLASPWSLAGVVVVAEFELRALWGTKSSLVSTLVIQPLVYMVLLTAGLQSLIGPEHQLEGGNYITYVFPGLLALQAIREFSGAIYRSTAERRWGQLALKRLAGVGSLGYVLGMTPGIILSFVVQAVVLTPLGLWLGVQVSAQGLLAVVGLGSILLLFWSALALLVTALIRNYQQRDVTLSILMLPMMFSAPIFFSLADVPRYLQIIAWLNPLTYQVVAMRDAFNGRFEPGTLVIVLVCTMLTIIAATISVTRTDLLGSERG